MGFKQGRIVRGVLHSTDNTTAETIPLFKDGQDGVSDTVGDSEFLQVDQIIIVTATGGDTRIFIGDDATPGDGEDILRGSFNAGGGASMIYGEWGPTGAVGESPYCLSASAGAVDVILLGRILEA